MLLPSVYAAVWKPNQLIYVAWGALIWVLGLAPIIVAVASPRLFRLNDLGRAQAESGEQGGLPYWTSLGMTAVMLGLGVAVLLLGLASRGGKLPRAGLGLWLAGMALAFGPILSSVLGLQPTGFSATLFGLPLVLTAVYLLPPVPLSWFVRRVKEVILLYAYGSLLASLVAPGWAMQSNYLGSLVPGFDVRLYGLTSHPNALAPLLLFYLILDFYPPFRTRWWRLHQGVNLLALILTQSKTVLVLLVLAYLIRLAYTASSSPGRLQRYSALALLGALISAVITYLAIGPAWLESAQASLSMQQLESLSTLSSRTLIWQITMDLWAQNPLFGYGPALWGPEMRFMYAPLFSNQLVAHAHNQFYQTLGESGIIGVAGLILYTILLLVYGRRYAKISGGITLVIVLTMITRGITEPLIIPLLPTTNFYLNFCIFSLLILASRQAGPVKVRSWSLRRLHTLPKTAAPRRRSSLTD